MIRLIIALLIVSSLPLTGQNLYFPPTSGDIWETTHPDELNWCDEKIQNLLTYLGDQNTKAFIILKDGKIVIEEYFDGFEQDDAHQWNSAGKTLTAFLTGMAQEDGSLEINDKTSDYLAKGWTTLSEEKEDLITIKNQLTMTSGLDDSGDPFCTDKACLTYLTDAGTRWAYHNGPYTLLSDVIANASGRSMNIYTNMKIGSKIGLSGLWVAADYNKIFFSNPRSMARFGLLMLNRGDWDGEVVMNDKSYFDDMINTSQDLNKSYGYLWWLNGKESYLVPGFQLPIRQSMTPNAPDDMYSALGKNSQILSIVPSQNMVVIRMGDNPDNSLIGNNFLNEMWEYISDLDCNPSSSNELTKHKNLAFPNPFSDKIQLQTIFKSVILYNQLGAVVLSKKNTNQLNTSELNSGIYFLELENAEGQKTKFKVLKN